MFTIHLLNLIRGKKQNFLKNVSSAQKKSVCDLIQFLSAETILLCLLFLIFCTDDSLEKLYSRTILA